MAYLGFALTGAAMLAWQPAVDASSCQITYSAGPQITELMSTRGFAFESYDRLCAALRQHGLELTITGMSGTELERAYGWATVTPLRSATGALSRRDHLATMLDTIATEAGASDALYAAVNDAANGMIDQITVHVRLIEAEEARLRAAFSAEQPRQ